MYTLDDLVKDEQLTEIINKYWEDYVEHKNLDIVVKPSIPIIWFGDLVAYKNSDLKVVTVAINPSDDEFKNTKKEISFNRFPYAEKLTEKEKLDVNDRVTLIKSYNDYFTVDPYPNFFERGYEKVLEIFSTSYGYNKSVSKAIHIDCISALATDLNWSQLKDKQESIRNIDFFENVFEKMLLDYLEPDIIILSSNQPTLEMFVGKQKPLSEYEKKTSKRKIKSFNFKNKGKLLIYMSNNDRGPTKSFTEEEYKREITMIRENLWDDNTKKLKINASDIYSTD